MATYRLQKIVARGGLASRRKAEELIAAGRVRVNGRTVTELGAKADPTSDKIEVDGKRVIAEDFVYVVLHKPRGVVSTMSDPEGRPTVRDYLTKVPGRVYSVGRLDFATSGVLLATNDGDFAGVLLHPRKSAPKTYVVKVAGEMQTSDLERWQKGVRLDDGVTRPAEVSFLRHEDGKTWFQLTLREGRNQQVRRMGEATGFPVMRLARISFAGVTSEGLRPGDFRYLTRDELIALRKEFGVPKRVPTMPAVALPKPGSRPVRTPRPARPSGDERRPRLEERAPRGRAEERAPRARMEERAPRGRAEERAPRGRAEERAPRARTDARPRARTEDRAPRARVEERSRGRTEERAPRGRTDERGPRGRTEERAPRARTEERPRARTEERAPRGRAEERAPRPRTEERPRARPVVRTMVPDERRPRPEARGARPSSDERPARSGRGRGTGTNRDSARTDARQPRNRNR